MAMSKIFRIWEKSVPPNPHSVLLEHRTKSDSILFESHSVAKLSSQECETVRKQYTKLCDAYGCLGVLQLNAGESTVLFLVMVTGCVSTGKIGDAEIFRVTQTQFVSLQTQVPHEDKVSEVRKLLNSGVFYFSHAVNANKQSSSCCKFDITLCAQRRQQTSETDNRFFWNRMLHIHMLRYGIDCSAWLIKVMCGSVEIRTVYIGAKQAKAAIISRLSCERAGTRFNTRGTNDEGHVANFVETEQVIYVDNDVSSYVQTRGSVPLFWEQPGVQVGSHKVKLSRGFEASASAFDRHMQIMKDRYGLQMIVNLLGTSQIGSKEGEAMLSNEFQRHHNMSNHKEVPHIIFDYHQECRGSNFSALSKLKSRIDACGVNFGYFYASNNNIIREQIGTIRTNCLDCLDRTNCVQTFLGLEMLNIQIESMRLGEKKQNLSRFEEIFRQMWVNNGNEVSKIYAGTGAIQGGSKLIDGARSAARTIQNNLLDNSKQEAIDVLLLGSTLSSELADRARILLPSNMLHAPVTVLREMCKRYNEYINIKNVRVAVGTYNVAGGKNFRAVDMQNSLREWLLDSFTQSSSKELVLTNEGTEQPVDIYAIGFQEIVDLNASNIMAASSENAKMWTEELQKSISRDNSYVLLTYQQLVGVCLYIYIRPEKAPYIRDLAIDCVKTGLGGATGNKGASAIRFVLHGTSMCFVCAHFAAGQSQVSERNADYAEVTRRLAFPMGRTLKSHDYVFWCGDFNYRIDMDKEELKEAIEIGRLESVLENDQLRKEQEAGNVFNDFLEGEITFDPTYKYDMFSEMYDTSEKMRAPAWTDRVLWRRRKALAESEVSADWNPGKLIYYGRSELTQSDHRPVLALIDCEVVIIDSTKRKKVFQNVINDLGPPDSTIIVHVNSKNNDETNDDQSLYDENVMNFIIQQLSKFGEVTLVRYVDDTMWVTFRDGESALNAVAQKTATICDLELSFELKSKNWNILVDQEIALCTSNTIPLCAHPLKKQCDDSYVPEIPQRPKQQPPRPPNRPPLPLSPKNTPHNSPHRLPHAGVISISPQMQQKDGEVLSTPQQQQQRPIRPPALAVAEAIEEFPNSGFNKASNEKQNCSPTHNNQKSVDEVSNLDDIYEEITVSTEYSAAMPHFTPPVCPESLKDGNCFPLLSAASVKSSIETTFNKTQRALPPLPSRNPPPIPSRNTGPPPSARPSDK
ncbi:synaptojanin-1 [Episyrphus balteatus]|uniref:synaptojanin-1 n=1 Tax=Episyrphus balteatus TaxID=286459 RepID=UPI0024866EA0|nr:synaptojanin-1 [Episyrphus balteatus]XP_055839398.1 synaptojanin-1 [Episyrphus balteatus]XP_055839406.1 synaptojanin-1 [Episyrphus balteatus]XP_055839415.1 synaptojanin-1 [Episyrphus balteatus]